MHTSLSWHTCCWKIHFQNLSYLFINIQNWFLKNLLNFGLIIMLCSLMLDKSPPGTIISHLNHSSTQNLGRNKPLCNTNTMLIAQGNIILTEKSLPFKNTGCMWRQKPWECNSVHYCKCQYICVCMCQCIYIQYTCLYSHKYISIYQECN